MTRTIVPGDFERTETWTPQFFSQSRQIIKTHNLFQRNGFKRKFEKKKGKEGKLPKIPSVYSTPDVKRLTCMNFDAEPVRASQAIDSKSSRESKEEPNENDDKHKPIMPEIEPSVADAEFPQQSLQGQDMDNEFVGALLEDSTVPMLDALDA
ncbi:hypothetical protein CYMTET_39417 [Cymbomonas tetramitiformis]|uniref:Uncharacterized protein n=1 Tax=Cymbomonas tetramitiformis TaxID=36881 RepID=A0AAE0F5L8_9CHLO|nr:hypothetical protein CYMTET_43913 [Cymbomonas tetramitiformis]KAK3251230.1 hypothetical protein CYMTET_39417 [Cymbomonas tetramitiformis]